MFADILKSCSTLAAIPADAAEAHAQAVARLQEHVNGQLEDHPKLHELIGRNPLEVMRDTHQYHARFMATVFRLNSFELMARTIPWLYRAYHARGFSYDYFPVEMVAWQIAVKVCLDKSVPKTEILAVYEWLVQNHERLIDVSRTGEGLSFSLSRETAVIQETFLSLLLNGDSQGCLKLADHSIQSADELKCFYLDIVWPALYRIGYLWESNQISVAEEHLATAIVARLMASLYARFASFTSTRGRIVVSASPNEMHEIGARMVADFLELDGWDVSYLGANTPEADIVAHLKKEQPFMVALSVATVFNLENARRLIQLIKTEPETAGIKVMVGGFAFAGMPDLYRLIGADGYAADAGSAIAVSAAWWSPAGNGAYAA